MEMNGFRIMVIDDENIVGRTIKAVFEQDGYIVETFLDAKPAFARLKEAKFDLVITDLKMKDIDGMEVLRVTKKEFPEIKVIMLTAFANMDASIQAFRERVDDFFPKPVKIADLKDCVKRLLFHSTLAAS